MSPYEVTYLNLRKRMLTDFSKANGREPTPEERERLEEDARAQTNAVYAAMLMAR